MVKKVALDTLEVENLESVVPEIPLPAEELPVEEVPGKASLRWLISKWLWIGVAGLVILIAAAGVSYWLLGTKKIVAHAPAKTATAAAPLPVPPSTAKVNDFIIIFQDSTGQYRVMTCDLTLEVSPGRDAQLQQHVGEVRKAIFDVLKQTKAASLMEPRTKVVLEEEITKALSVLVGPGTINAIYFTKYVVI